jgi:hypothetical protein
MKSAFSAKMQEMRLCTWLLYCCTSYFFRFPYSVHQLIRAYSGIRAKSTRNLELGT